MVFEVFFDISYLVLVICLGIRLLFVKDKTAKIFGIMSILLGFGDAFHLIPRMFANIEPNGFEIFQKQLLIGELVTGITMTIFYLLYYYFYEIRTGNKNKKLKLTMYALVLIRIIIMLLPQNQWTNGGSYIMGLIRNIPFAIIGIITIYLSLKTDDKLLKKLGILTIISFACYLPVVIFKEKYPMVGMLMMPKTVAYLLMSYYVFKEFVYRFTFTNILELSTCSLITGLLFGVFYREATKYFFDQTTMISTNILSKMHVHILVLGFITLALLFVLFKKLYKEDELEKLKRPVHIYVSGLFITNLVMFVRGIYYLQDVEVPVKMSSAFSGIAGLGHILLGVSLVVIMVKIVNKNKAKELAK